MKLLVNIYLSPLAVGLNLHKCIKMCLIHNILECLVGNITPAGGIPKAEKNRREALLMDYIRWRRDLRYMERI
jgi:putative hydrolases of HD superfamily